MATITPYHTVDALGLGTRAATHLRNDNIVYVGDMIQKTRGEMLSVPGLGKVTYSEMEAALARHGLTFGTVSADWPPSNIEALAA